MGSKRETNLALTRYNSILGYLQYENNAYWKRSNFYLTANAILLGFVVSNLTSSVLSSFLLLSIQLIVSISGIFLCIIWNYNLNKGEMWIKHWLQLLNQLESKAYENISLFDKEEGISGRGIMKSTKWTNQLFIVLWGIVLVSLIVIICFKACGGDIP